ncbi:MAG: hypothetical protein HC912_05350 [Saprospiraceae bacterium]|nr:hypothetical protein [Saprospiraceae bacterium]
MHYAFTSFLMLIMLSMLMCGVHPSKTPTNMLPYAFNEPSKILELPSELVEISGIALSIDEQYFFAIQDEQGLIFKIDRSTGEVIANFRFEKMATTRILFKQTAICSS